MGKAKFTDENIKKRVFTILDIDKKNDTFTYIDEAGDEKEGCLGSVFDNIPFPLDITLKTSKKDELDVTFEKPNEEDNDEDED